MFVKNKAESYVFNLSKMSTELTLNFNKIFLCAKISFSLVCHRRRELSFSLRHSFQLHLLMVLKIKKKTCKGDSKNRIASSFPYNITPESHQRIKEMITYQRSSRLLNKFSFSALKEMYGKQYGNYTY